MQDKNINEIIEDILSQLKPVMKPERYYHTIGVTYTCALLAKYYNENVEKAMLAGVLHDCAKSTMVKDNILACEKANIPVSEEEKLAPSILHAPLGAYLARERFQIHDDEVLHAIEVHTTGCEDMSLLDKILFVADYIEPNRRELPGLKEIREAAFKDLNYAVFLETEDVLAYLNTLGRPIDKQTKITHDYYKNLIEKGE